MSRGTLGIDGRCVLCGKTREQVKKLILGVHGGVCLDCVELCNDIIRSESPDSDRHRLMHPGSVPKPKEINRILSQYVVGQERAKQSLAAIMTVGGGGCGSVMSFTEVCVRLVFAVERHEQQPEHIEGSESGGEQAD